MLGLKFMLVNAALAHKDTKVCEMNISDIPNDSSLYWV